MQQTEKERSEFSIGELASEFDVTPRSSQSAKARKRESETIESIQKLKGMLHES